MHQKPSPTNSESEKELEKAEKQFEAFDNQIKDMTLDRMNTAPKEEVEPQTKIAQKDLEKQKEIYLKPKRRIISQEKFNEKFRAEYDFQKEYVSFVAENKEIIGEDITLWAKPFPGLPCEEWVIPTNKVIWAPRYIAERVKGCSYHRFVMKQHVRTEDNLYGEMYGAMAVDTIVSRLDAVPASKRKSIFMGSVSF
jgi:hypothetical protein